MYLPYGRLQSGLELNQSLTYHCLLNTLFCCIHGFLATFTTPTFLPLVKWIMGQLMWSSETKNFYFTCLSSVHVLKIKGLSSWPDNLVLSLLTLSFKTVSKISVLFHASFPAERKIQMFLKGWPGLQESSAATHWRPIKLHGRPLSTCVVSYSPLSSGQSKSSYL